MTRPPRSDLALWDRHALDAADHTHLTPVCKACHATRPIWVADGTRVGKISAANRAATMAASWLAHHPCRPVRTVVGNAVASQTGERVARQGRGVAA